MESMKRIDVLKGIEQLLVQKAYETGHISHRADGDWQKQADGSWTPYTGQSAQNPNKKDRYGFNLLPDEDKQSYLDRANGDAYQAQILYEKDVENSPMGGLDAEEDQYNEITEEDLKDSDEEILSDEAYEHDEEDRQKMSNYDAIKHIINDNHDYDADIKTIEFRDEGDGEFVPHDDDYFRVVDKIWSDNDGFGFSGEDFEDEDSKANELYSNIVDLVTDRAYALRNNEDSKPQERKLTPEEISELVKITDINERKKRQAEMLAQKSAVRDMRSTPATKNMGF